MDQEKSHCQNEQIAAYVDGELDAHSLAQFENHLPGCASCRAELNSQRLLMCDLDQVLARTSDFPVPQNFAQVVAARAESDMSGLRKRVEHQRALRICLLLAITSFVLLGATSSRVLFFNVAGKAFSLFGVLWTTIYDAAVGLTVISRVISGTIVTSPFAGLMALLLALAVVLLSLMISSYHEYHEMQLSD